MIVFISGGALTVIFLLMVLCADYILSEFMLWVTAHWAVVQAFVYLIFAVVLICEVIGLLRSKKNKNQWIVCWFAFWNALRSFAAAKYWIFIISDLAFHYETLGFFEKILAAIALPFMLIPFLPYFLFEVVVYMRGVSMTSIFTGGLISIVGEIVLSILLFGLPE